MKIKFSPRAERDLLDIYRYITQQNPLVAKQFTLAIREKVMALAEYPMMGRTGQLTGTRELVCHRNYIAVYKIEKEHIVILRVRHAARRWPARL